MSVLLICTCSGMAVAALVAKFWPEEKRGPEPVKPSCTCCEEIAKEKVTKSLIFVRGDGTLHRKIETETEGTN